MPVYTLIDERQQRTPAINDNEQRQRTMQ